MQSIQRSCLGWPGVPSYAWVSCWGPFLRFLLLRRKSYLEEPGFLYLDCVAQSSQNNPLHLILEPV